MSTFSPETINNQLERIKQRKRLETQQNPNSSIALKRPYDEVQQYTDFGPQELDTKLLENPLVDQLQDTVLDGDNEATATEVVKARNRQAYKAYKDAQKQLQAARRNQVKLNQGAPTYNPNTGQYENAPSTGSPAGPGSSYYTQTPKWLDINAGMTTFNVGGRSYTVNASVANRFKGFLTELVGMGYKIKSHGSFADRNQANGSGQKSLHAYGLAIDLNPFGHGNSFNPGNKGVHQTNLPKGISALARKYGLVWGGDWRNSKDYMHFSVPYGGRL